LKQTSKSTPITASDIPEAVTTSAVGKGSGSLAMVKQIVAEFEKL